MAHVCIGDLLQAYNQCLSCICMDLRMWQLYQEHNYYYLLLNYSFCRETYRY